MKKPIKKKKSAKKMLNPKNKLAKRKGPPKRLPMKTRAGGKKAISGEETAALLLEEVREKSRGLDTVAFPPEETGEGAAGRASYREICRDCPILKTQIRKVWPSCWRKETRSRPMW